MQEVTVVNLPTTALWILAVGQIVFALAIAAIAIVLILLLGQIKQALAQVIEAEQQLNARLPKMLNNVEMMVNDVANTTHKGTGVANQVLNLVSAIVARLESPLVRSVGIFTGVMAGLKALRGANRANEREVIIEKRRGFLGRKK